MTESLTSLVARSSVDPALREALVADPRAALLERGLVPPDNLHVQVEASTPTKLVISIPPVLSSDADLSDDALEHAAGGATPMVAAVTITGTLMIGGGAGGWWLGDKIFG